METLKVPFVFVPLLIAFHLAHLTFNNWLDLCTLQGTKKDPCCPRSSPTTNPAIEKDRSASSSLYENAYVKCVFRGSSRRIRPVRRKRICAPVKNAPMKLDVKIMLLNLLFRDRMFVHRQSIRQTESIHPAHAPAPPFFGENVLLVILPSQT